MTNRRGDSRGTIGVAEAAWERRQRAAWIDYLRATREAGHADYEQAEANAWELLQRRLRRNDEILAGTTRTVTV